MLKPSMANIQEKKREKIKQKDHFIIEHDKQLDNFWKHFLVLNLVVNKHDINLEITTTTHVFSRVEIEGWRLMISELSLVVKITFVGETSCVCLQQADSEI